MRVGDDFGRVKPLHTTVNSSQAKSMVQSMVQFCQSIRRQVNVQSGQVEGSTQLSSEAKKRLKDETLRHL